MEKQVLKLEKLFDSFGRVHDYLRISLTENCNLRCSYCMPEEKIQLTPKNQLMSADEVYAIAKSFVELGVTKIRLTGGEPLVRKDFVEILEKISLLNVNLSLTTNAVLLDQFFEVLEENGIKNLNISLDSLDSDRNFAITKRNHLEKVLQNIELAYEKGFSIKINCVLIKGENENEIVDFIRLSQNKNIVVRFIEFMPFKGNQWDKSKLVSLKEIMQNAENAFGRENIITLENHKNDTSKNFRILGYKGRFGVISSVTNPFCDGCNRLRLTANGQMRNCLFSTDETDVLGAYRIGKNIKPIIQKHLYQKKKVRNGMDSLEKLSIEEEHQKNRSMIRIGG